MLWEEQGHFVGRKMDKYLLICLVLSLVWGGGGEEESWAANFPRGLWGCLDSWEVQQMCPIYISIFIVTAPLCSAQGNHCVAIH